MPTLTYDKAMTHLSFHKLPPKQYSDYGVCVWISVQSENDACEAQGLRISIRNRNIILIVGSITLVTTYCSVDEQRDFSTFDLPGDDGPLWVDA